VSAWCAVGSGSASKWSEVERSEEKGRCIALDDVWPGVVRIKGMVAWAEDGPELKTRQNSEKSVQAEEQFAPYVRGPSLEP
jgi:hypothetical protein